MELSVSQTPRKSLESGVARSPQLSSEGLSSPPRSSPEVASPSGLITVEALNTPTPSTSSSITAGVSSTLVLGVQPEKPPSRRKPRRKPKDPVTTSKGTEAPKVKRIRKPKNPNAPPAPRRKKNVAPAKTSPPDTHLRAVTTIPTQTSFSAPILPPRAVPIHSQQTGKSEELQILKQSFFNSAPPPVTTPQTQAQSQTQNTRTSGQKYDPIRSSNYDPVRENIVNNTTHDKPQTLPINPSTNNCPSSTPSISNLVEPDSQSLSKTLPAVQSFFNQHQTKLPLCSGPPPPTSQTSNQVDTSSTLNALEKPKPSIPAATAKKPDVVMSLSSLSKKSDVVSSSSVSKKPDVVSSSSLSKKSDVVSSSSVSKKPDELSSSSPSKKSDVVSSSSVSKKSDVVSSSSVSKKPDVVSSSSLFKKSDVVSSSSPSKKPDAVSSSSISNKSDVVSSSSLSKKSDVVSSSSPSKKTDVAVNSLSLSKKNNNNNMISSSASLKPTKPKETKENNEIINPIPPPLPGSGNEYGDGTEYRAPTVILTIPIYGEVNKYVNFTRLAEQQYGWDALHPRLAAQRDRLARIAAAGAALERNGSSKDSGDEMSLDSEGEGSNVEMGGMSDGRTGADYAKKVPKKRKMREDEYDKDDGFVDDTELLWEEQAAASNDGFFVYSGPLIPEGDKAGSDGKTDGASKRGRGRGSRGGAARSSTARSTTASTSTTARNNLPASGPGSRGGSTARKPRVTKAERARMEQEKLEREKAGLTSTPPINNNTMALASSLPEASLPIALNE